MEDPSVGTGAVHRPHQRSIYPTAKSTKLAAAHRSLPPRVFRRYSFGKISTAATRLFRADVRRLTHCTMFNMGFHYYHIPPSPVGRITLNRVDTRRRFCRVQRTHLPDTP